MHSSATHHPALDIPHSALRTPHSIKVRSVSENVTRELPLEEYLAGVLAGESSIENELEALKAQAVISRTFALKNLGRHAREGFDFCSTTHCQRFVLAKDRLRSSARRAVEMTMSEALLDGTGELIDGYFHAACGGVTANIESLWGIPAPSYLRGVRDDFCTTMPHRRWIQTIPEGQLVKALQSDERTNIGSKLDSIIVSKRDATGRAELITLEGARRRVIPGWGFKIIIGRSLGWQMIKSSRFDVTRSGKDFVFRGTGFGHGLGLCQEGAHIMARRGMNYRQILNHYFPGTKLKQMQEARRTEYSIGPEDVAFANDVNQLQSTFAVFQVKERGKLSLSSEHFRASFPPEAERDSVETALRILETAHADLLRRVERASLRLPSPFEIVIHATTADFIEVTGQSGWVAGVTRGRRIELQPLRVLQNRGILATTLRHELTHAVIEVLSNSHAPRWLSEGLAIHCSGEGTMMMQVELKDKIDREELERKLAQKSSPKVMRELYATAYREVLALIQSNGEQNVWWLVAKHKWRSKA